MELVFLETNAVGHLMPKTDSERDRERRSRLSAAVRDRRLSVVASTDLLQELAAIGAMNWPAHLRILGYLRSIADPHLLKDTLDLSLGELRLGHALKQGETRISRTRSEQAWAMVMDEESVAEITRDAQADADQFLDDEKGLRARADAALRAVTPAGDAVEPNVWSWWNERPRDHIRDFARETAQKHGARPGIVLHRLPAFWRYHAYKVARIALMHARREGGGLKKTDAMDARHYAAAGYADVFVSDDEPLHRTAEAIPGLRRPITLDQFAREHLGEG